MFRVIQKKLHAILPNPVAFLGLSLVLLAALELFLTISHRGRPPGSSALDDYKPLYVDIFTPFFAKTMIGAEWKYVSVRDQSCPANFSVQKTAGTFRVFLLGESVIQLLSQTPGKFRALLKKALPGKTIEIINCGMGGYDSFRTGLIAREIVHYDPDLVIWAGGNNEYYPEGHFSLPEARIKEFLARFWTFRLLSSFFNDPLTSDPCANRQRSEILADFRTNVQKMIDTVRSRNIPMIVCTLPLNLSGCAPSLMIPRHPLLDKAFQYYEEGKIEDAAAMLEQFPAEDPNSPLILFYLGKIYQREQSPGKAQTVYLQALDKNYCHGQACPASNRLIRQLAAENKIILADLEKAFMRLVPDAIPGAAVFYDHCHWRSCFDDLAHEIIVGAWQNQNPSDQDRLSEEIVQPYRLMAQKQDPDYFEKTFFCCLFNCQQRSSRQPPSEKELSLLQNLYEADAERLFQTMNSRETTIKKYLAQSDIVISAMEAKTAWENILYATGEVFRRNGKYKKALMLLEKALSFKNDAPAIHLALAKTYSVFGEGEKAEFHYKKSALRL